MADSERFRPDIQGLRAVAVGAVVLNHVGVPFVSGGYVGVDVFFVISGFLISTHLLTGLEREGRIRFASFSAKRARRILPAALVVLVLSVIGALIWVPPLQRIAVLRDVIATALSVPNYAFAAQGTDYLQATAPPSVFQHYWSLGVEEQFYLIWPALLALVWLVRRSRRALAVVFAIVVVSSLACAIVLTTVSQPWAFFSLWARAWEFGVGGLVALALRARPRVLPPVAAGIAGWAGLGGIVAAVLLYGDGTAFPGVAAILPVVATGLVILAGATPVRGGAQLVLGTRPFQFVGLISYSLYLVHWPVLQLAQAAVGYDRPLPPWTTVLLGALCVPLAWLLCRFVETPARQAPWLVRARPRRSLGAAGVGAVITAGLAAAALGATSIPTLAVAQTLPITRPTDPPAATPVVASNLTPSLRSGSDDLPVLDANGCELGYAATTPKPCTFGSGTGRTIALFGDSHAATWFPALQRIVVQNGDTLVSDTKSACASVDIAIELNGSRYAACDAWRQNVIDRLRADPPALVVLASYANPVFASPKDEAGQWRRGLQRTLAQLQDVTRVVVMADTPDMGTDPATCLSAHLDDAAACAKPASTALDTPGRAATRAAAAEMGAPVIDLTPYFCTDRCAPIIGNLLVYRDSHHMTATYATALAGPLSRRLLPQLPPSD